MTKSPATAAPCGLIQLGEVTCGAVAVLLGCAFGEVTVGAPRIPAPRSGQPARGSGPVSGSAARALWLAGPPDRLEESENDRTVADDCADLSA